MSKKVPMTSDDWADADPVHARATEWLVRLKDPALTPQEILAWQTWMRKDPLNAEAFQRMEETEQLLREMARPPPATARELSRDAYDGSVPIRLWRRPPTFGVRWALAASILAAALGLAVAWRPWLAGLTPRAAATLIATPIGRDRTVRLADGSIVTLGADSRIAVRFRRGERDIDLLQGEAFFAVVHNPERPFKVAAGRAMVIDVGTKFNVIRYHTQVVVDVIEGRVTVVPRAGFVPLDVLRAFRPMLIPVSLGAGQETTVDSIEIAPPLKIADPEAVTAWRSGRLAFRMQPLGEVLQDVNRYSRKPIVAADPGIERIDVTGTIVNGNVTGWLASLRSALGIVAVEEPDRIVLRRHAP
jgi:transmembrane sensor